MLKEQFTRDWQSKFGALLLRTSLGIFKKQFDYSEYGGAPLLGINGALVKCHGSSGTVAIKNGLLQAARFVEQGVVQSIQDAVTNQKWKDYENASKENCHCYWQHCRHPNWGAKAIRHPCGSPLCDLRGDELSRRRGYYQQDLLWNVAQEPGTPSYFSAFPRWLQCSLRAFAGYSRWSSVATYFVSLVGDISISCPSSRHAGNITYHGLRQQKCVAWTWVGCGRGGRGA